MICQFFHLYGTDLQLLLMEFGCLLDSFYQVLSWVAQLVVYIQELPGKYSVLQKITKKHNKMHFLEPLRCYLVIVDLLTPYRLWCLKLPQPLICIFHCLYVWCSHMVQLCILTSHYTLEHWELSRSPSSMKKCQKSIETLRLKS